MIRRHPREPKLGPRATAIIHGVLDRLAGLQPCEHLAASPDEAVWIAAQPDRLLCLEFCWGAAQVLATVHHCVECGRPAEQDQGGSVILFKWNRTLAMHFWMCSGCADADGPDSGQ
jgi:hypothetical protein